MKICWFSTDPVAGLVEVPCVMCSGIKCDSFADMVLAGVTSRIPDREVIEAMYVLDKQCLSVLRETGRGGLAGTPTGQRLNKKYLVINYIKANLRKLYPLTKIKGLGPKRLGIK